jgi:hypothetical protein
MRPPFLAAIILACSLWGIMAGSALADDPANDLGSWVNANSTVRFSDRWSVFAQAEVRHWAFASNLNEILLRGAGHYDFSPRAMGGLGYVRVDFRAFEDGNNGNRDIIENRLYQQFAIKQAWGAQRLSIGSDSSSAGSIRREWTTIGLERPNIPTGGATAFKSSYR